MPKMPDGSVVSSYFDIDSLMTGNDIYAQGMTFMLGQVEKIHFIDDSSNISKKFVEYDVSARDEKGGQSVFRNVRAQSSIFGANDFEETILEPNEFAFSGALNPSNFFSNKNGTIVLLASLNGSKDKPFIAGTLPHPRKFGAKRKDGIRKLGEFRGIQWEVNKDGEFTLTYLGNRSPNGKLVRAETGPTKINVDKSGILRISDNKNQKIEMNRTNTTISVSNGTTTTFDGANDKITVLTAKGTKVQIDGSSDDVLIKTAGTAELHLKEGKVAIGASGTEVLEQISQFLQETITMANAEAAHTHVGNLGYPTAPPSSAGDWSGFASALASIKGLIDGIKGTL